MPPTFRTLYPHQARNFGGSIGMSVREGYTLYAPFTPRKLHRVMYDRTDWGLAYGSQSSPSKRGERGGLCLNAGLGINQ